MADKASTENTPAAEIESPLDFTGFGLDERLLKALDKQGMQQPTPVQQQTLADALAGHDLLVSAETGSGKTAAYLLPVLQQLLKKSQPDTATRALILLPTRELARQVMKHCNDLLVFTKLQIGLITGGADLKYQSALLRKNPEIVIATPGRILEHLSRNSIDLSDLEILVLDEGDRMLDLGLGEDVLSIAAACRPEHQALLFSATLRHQGVKSVARKVLKTPQEHILNQHDMGQESIRQEIVLADDSKHKQRLLVRLLQQETFQQAVVFTNTRDMAEQVGGVLRYHDIRASVLHGEMEQVERNKVMDRLRRGQIDVLVATDVAARGIDVKTIELVVNFDMTRKGDDHVHRVGRTGRSGEPGLAISMVTASEWNLMASIERYLKIKFERRLVKGLEGSYKGPKKLKASGKAASGKKRNATGKSGKKRGDSKAEGTADKSKQRHRDRKTVGKRRQPKAEDNVSESLSDGFAPLKKR